MPNLTIPNTFSNVGNEIADATKVNANFNAVATLLNSTGLDSSGLAANSVITQKILDSNVTTAKIADGAVTSVKLADGAVTAAKKASLGENLSTSSGITTVTSASPHIGSNASLTTTGRPVMIMLQPDGTANPAYISVYSAGGAITQTYVTVTLKRGSTAIALWRQEILGDSSANLSLTTLASLSFIDTGASAGANTWHFEVVVGSAAMNAKVYYLKTVAFEL